MGTAIKHPLPDGVKPSFVIFDIWALWCSALCQKPQISDHSKSFSDNTLVDRFFW